MEKVYTADEVSEHNSENDLWMTIHGGVYNLTDFLTKHPGGEEVLINLAGKDGTVCFDEIGHTEEAIQLRETLKIGVATGTASGDGATKSSNKTREPTVDDDDWVYHEPKKESSPYLPIILAVGAVVYGVVIYYLLLA